MLKSCSSFTRRVDICFPVSIHLSIDADNPQNDLYGINASLRIAFSLVFD